MSKEAPKRLTLEERLADAARKKKTNKKVPNKDLNNAPQTLNGNINSKDKEIDNVNKTSNSNEEKESKEEDTPQTVHIIPEDYVTFSRDELESIIVKHVDQQLKSSNNEISTLKAQLNLKPSPKANTNNAVTDLERKLKEKEVQLEELMTEGIALSKKELSLNQSIKRMKKHEVELESELEESKSTVNELQGAIDGLEVKMENYSNIEKLIQEERESNQLLRQKYENLVEANESLTNELKEIKISELDIQLDSTKKELDEERHKSQKLDNDLQQVQNEFTNFKSSKLAAISQLESEYERSKQQIVELTRENQNEIKRLEDKMEVLRFQSENNVTSNKSVKEMEIIQAQFDQAQENWKLIESSYLKKIQGFETEIDELKTSNITFSKKIKSLTNDLKQKSLDYQLSQDNELTLQNTIESLNSKVKTLEADNSTLLKSFENLKKDYETEKTSFEGQLQNLENQNKELEETLKLRVELNNQMISTPTNFYLQDLSSSSSLNHVRAPSLTPYSASNKKFSIGFGESSTTPRPTFSNSFSRMNSVTGFNSMISPQEKILAHKNSLTSFDLDQDPLGINSTVFRESDEYDDDGLALGAEAGESSDHLSTLNGPHASISGSNNGAITHHIQIIKRLSSNVSRLEMKLNSTKDEIQILTAERDQAGSQIIKLMEENKKVNELENELQLKSDEVKHLEGKIDKVLVLLGEKEERVGELTADVDDLKDLLKQQVQQMVEMQEKISTN